MLSLRHAVSKLEIGHKVLILFLRSGGRFGLQASRRRQHISGWHLDLRNLDMEQWGYFPILSHLRIKRRASLDGLSSSLVYRRVEICRGYLAGGIVSSPPQWRPIIPSPTSQRTKESLLVSALFAVVVSNGHYARGQTNMESSVRITHDPHHSRWWIGQARRNLIPM